MNKIILVLGFAISLSNIAYSQQWIAFFAYPANETSEAGHAYISFIKRNNYTKQTIVENVWGFHPIKKSFRAIFGESGIIKNENNYNPKNKEEDGQYLLKASYDFIVQIEDIEVYENCKKIKLTWEQKKYSVVAGQTCVGYCKDVAAIIPGLSLPKKINLLNQWPKDFLINLKELNTDIDLKSRKTLSSIPQETTNSIDKINTKEDAVEWLAGKIKQHMKKPYQFVSNNQGLINYSLLTKIKVDGVDKKEEPYKINVFLNLNHIKYWDEQTKDNPDKLAFGSSDDAFFKLDFIRARDNKITKTNVSSKEGLTIFNFGKGEDHCDFSVEPNLIGNAKLVIAKIIEFNKSPILFSNSEAEQKKVKQAAIDFFKWHENVWESKENIRKLQSFKMIINKAGKPEEDDGNGCPCSIDWGVLDKFHNWIKSSGKLISDKCFLNSKSSIISIEQKLKRATTIQQNNEAIEEFFAKSMVNFFPGNSGAPKFSQSGIYANNAIWDISVASDGTAESNVTFQMPEGWAKEVGSYKLKMENENGSWKLASLIQEGIASTSFIPNRTALPTIPIDTKNLIGGETQIGLAQILLKALQTNNKETWIKCLHPNAPVNGEEGKLLVERNFKEIRDNFYGLGITDWSLVKFSRAIFSREQSWLDNGYDKGEKYCILEIEFYYNQKEYIGLIKYLSIRTFKGKYFINGMMPKAILKHNN